MMKRRRLAQSFLPETIEKRLAEREQAETKCTEALDALSSLDISLFSKDVKISEEQALLLLSAKLTFVGVVRLKMALDHVPTAINMKSRAANAPLRFSLVSEILAANGILMDSGEVQQYAEILQRYCPYFCQFGFDLSDTLWKLTSEGKFRFNKFISPPVGDSLIGACRVLRVNCRGSRKLLRVRKLNFYFFSSFLK